MEHKAHLVLLLVNSDNTYHLQSLSINFTTEGAFFTSVILACSPEDFVISGGFIQNPFTSDAITVSDSKVQEQIFGLWF